jgi:hypothetical protein
MKQVAAGDLSAFGEFSRVRASFRKIYMDFMRDVAAAIVENLGGKR